MIHETEISTYMNVGKYKVYRIPYMDPMGNDST